SSFALMQQRAVPAPQLGKATRYGYGIVLDSLDRQSVLWNSGATLGFRAYLLLDAASGVAIAVVMNGPGNARRVAEFAWRTCRALEAGAELPSLPPILPPTLVSNAADYAGEYADELGETIRIVAQGNTVVAELPEGRVALERLGADRFYANTERFALFPLAFGRDSSGTVVEFAYCGQWFASARH